MKYIKLSSAAIIFSLLSTTAVLAQGAGVCNRAAEEIATKVNEDANSWVDSIDPSLPQDEKDALTLLFNRNREGSRCS